MVKKIIYHNRVVLSLALWVFLVTLGLEAGAPPYLKQTWTMFPVNSNLGTGSMKVIGCPGDYPKILMHRTRDFLSLVQYQFGTFDYRSVWLSGVLPVPPTSYSYSIKSVYYQELIDLGRNEILVVSNQGYFFIDVDTRQILSSCELPHKIRADCLFDYEGDGDLDLAVSVDQFDDQLMIYDLESGDVLNEFPYSGNIIKVGQVDSDPGLELVFTDNSSDNVGYVLDLTENELQWVSYPSFGRELELADIDNDGQEELLVSGLNQELKTLAAFDLDQQELKWVKTDLNSRTNDLLVCDVDGDGHLEILRTAFEQDRVKCFNARDGQLIWKSEKAFENSRSIQCADFDLDGNAEIVFVSETPSSYQFQVLDPETRDIEWSADTIDSTYYSFDVSSQDRNGNRILAVSLTDISRSESELRYYDAATHRELRRTSLDYGDECRKLFFIDSHPDVPGQELGMIHSRMKIFNSDTMERLWKTKYDIYSAKVVDLDDDGNLEIVAGGGYRSSYDSHIIVYDALTGDIEYEGVNIEYSITSIDVADIDEDETMEIGFATLGRFYILNAGTYTYDWEQHTGNSTCFAFFDYFPDVPGIEVIEVNSDDGVYVYDGMNHKLLDCVPLKTQEYIDSVNFFDINNDGDFEIILLGYGKFLIIDQNGTLLWNEDSRFYTRFLDENLVCDDLNNDGFQELILATDTSVREYQYWSAASQEEPPCDVTGVSLDLSTWHFDANDMFYLNTLVCNAEESLLIDHHVMVLLGIFGEYFCLPSWISLDSGLDSYQGVIPPGRTEFNTVPFFRWPDVEGSVSGVLFYGAILDPEMSNVVGEMTIVEVGWSSS